MMHTERIRDAYLAREQADLNYGKVFAYAVADHRTAYEHAVIDGVSTAYEDFRVDYYQDVDAHRVNRTLANEDWTNAAGVSNRTENDDWATGLRAYEVSQAESRRAFGVSSGSADATRQYDYALAVSDAMLAPIQLMGIIVWRWTPRTNRWPPSLYSARTLVSGQMATATGLPFYQSYSAKQQALETWWLTSPLNISRFLTLKAFWFPRRTSPSKTRSIGDKVVL